MASITAALPKLYNVPGLRFFMRSFGAVIMCCGLLSACNDQARVRPYGYLRIGPVKDYLGAETFLPDMRLVLRHDERGISVMSTLCTHDLSPLVRKTGPAGEFIFVSEYSDSRYKDDGTLLHGPAIANLPYYKISVDEGVYGGPKDTLYVEIGKEVSADWRVAIPQILLSPPAASTPSS